MKWTHPLVVVLLTVAVPAHAYLTDITIHPAEPLDDQTVAITAVSSWGDGCFQYDRTEWSRDGFDITMSVYIYDAWNPGGFCIAIVVDYPSTVELGPLAPGTYQLQVIEYRDSLRVDPIETVNLEFEVQRSVANEEPTWSTLKAAYR